jgi:hypothetical protein
MAGVAQLMVGHPFDTIKVSWHSDTQACTAGGHHSQQHAARSSSSSSSIAYDSQQYKLPRSG